MKAIMISIKPFMVEKILNGEKTIEIRKTMPKCELPCKVYIYCTKARLTKQDIDCVRYDHLTKPHPIIKKYVLGANYGECLNGKVVAEFTLNKVDFINMPMDLPIGFLEKVCVNGIELMEYLGGDFYKDFYAWHIDNLYIYDKPKELSEFYSAKECPFKDWGDVDNIGCWESCCEMWSRGECRFGNLKLERPPQSWCYVEEMESE